MSMARLCRDQGKRQQGRDCLAPIYGWFTEGFDTLDLRQAKTLLDALAAEGDSVEDPVAGTLRPSGVLADGSEARAERTLEINPDRD